MLHDDVLCVLSQARATRTQVARVTTTTFVVAIPRDDERVYLLTRSPHDERVACLTWSEVDRVLYLTGGDHATHTR